MAKSEGKDKNKDKRSGEVSVKVSPETANEKPVRRTFPGPRGHVDHLRVATDRAAYAELVGHAKSSLSAEVCGVLVGQVCEDDDGLFVHIENTIPGRAASEGSTHVTFTQETWNSIHEVLERDHPKSRIVGWYHTHPGFGVEFSEMDVFIQQNFFAGRTQIALVTDPLNGDVAICLNSDGGIQYLPKFWVDSREQQCKVPHRAERKAAKEGAAPGEAGESGEALRALESRVGQLVQALDETRRFQYRFMMFCGMVFCLALIAFVGYSMYNQWVSRLEPPKLAQIVPVPLQIGDKTILLEVGIHGWQIPPELNAMMLQEAKARAALEQQMASNSAAGAAATNQTISPTNAGTNLPPFATNLLTTPPPGK